MVVEEIISNVSELVSVLPPGVVERVGGLITILKAVGIAFIIYVVYLVFMAVLNFRRMKRLGRVEKKVNSIDKKLNLLLKDKKKKK